MGFENYSAGGAEGENMLPENEATAEERENIEDDPVKSAIESLADDVLAENVDHEAVIREAKLTPEELTLLSRGAKPMEFLAMTDDERENLRLLQERVRAHVREMQSV